MPRLARLIVLSALLLPACFAGSEDLDVEPPPTNILRVDPPGLVMRSREPVEQALTLTNRADAPIEIEWRADTAPAACADTPEVGLCIEYPTRPLRLDPGAQYILPVRFVPPSAPALFDARLELFCARAFCDQEVPLSGEYPTADDQGLLVQPRQLTIEAQDLGLPSTGRVIIENPTARAQTITSVQLMGDGFTLFGPPFPFELPAGEDLVLSIDYAANDNEVRQGQLRISRGGDVYEVGLQGYSVGVCAIEVDPSFHWLGEVRVGSETRVDVAMRNVGRGSCPVRLSTTASTAAGELRILGPRALDVPPRPHVTVQLELHARCPGPLETALTITAPGLMRDVSLHADVRGAEPLIVPDELDFGRLGRRCRAPFTVDVYNSTNVAMTLLGTTGPGGVLDDPARYPLVIPVGRRAPLDFELLPLVTGAHRTYVDVLYELAPIVGCPAEGSERRLRASVAYIGVTDLPCD